MTNERKRMFDIRGAKARFHLYQEGARVRFSSSPPLWGGFRRGLFSSSTAQFMQADNYIQTPEDYIGYNRYAYCRYNPFKYTDPSGEEPVLITINGELWGAKMGQQVDCIALRIAQPSMSSLPTMCYTSSLNTLPMNYNHRDINYDVSDESSPARCGSSNGNGGGRKRSSSSNNAGVYNGFTGDAAPKNNQSKPLITTTPIKQIFVPQLTNPQYYPGYFGEQSITPNNPELDIYFGVTMVSDALLITKGIIRVVLEAAASRALRRESARLADEIGELLGEGARMKRNPSGDPIFISKDGLSKVRWDWKGKGNDVEHMHFEILNKNGKWVDAVKGKHRIYFKGK